MPCSWPDWVGGLSDWIGSSRRGFTRLNWGWSSIRLVVLGPAHGIGPNCSSLLESNHSVREISWSEAVCFLGNGVLYCTAKLLSMAVPAENCFVVRADAPAGEASFPFCSFVRSCSSILEICMSVPIPRCSDFFIHSADCYLWLFSYDSSLPLVQMASSVELVLVRLVVLDAWTTFRGFVSGSGSWFKCHWLTELGLPELYGNIKILAFICEENSKCTGQG